MPDGWLVGFCWFVSLGRARSGRIKSDGWCRLIPSATATHTTYHPPPGLVEINPLSLGVGKRRSLDCGCWGRPLTEFMSVRSFPWFICGGDWSEEFSRRWPAPPPPPVQPFLDGGSKPPLPPRLRRLSIQCHSAGLPPPERCGCDVSCPLEALFSACLVASHARLNVCCVCVRLCSRVRN